MPSFYTIEINEAQRLALIDVLNRLHVHQGENEPLEYWDLMLLDLPRIENENPKIIHGFCL